MKREENTQGGRRYRRWRSPSESNKSSGSSDEGALIAVEVAMRRRSEGRDADVMTLAEIERVEEKCKRGGYNSQERIKKGPRNS